MAKLFRDDSVKSTKQADQNREQMEEMNRDDSEISGGPGNKLPLTSQMSDLFTLLRNRYWKNLWTEYRVLSLVAIAFMVVAVAGISVIIYGIYFGATHQSSSTTLAPTAPTTLTPTAPTTLSPTAPTTLTPTALTSLTPTAPTTLDPTASTSLTPVPGILIAGGHGDASNSTEIFLPLSGQTCALADDMPGGQVGGTMSTVDDRAVFCYYYSCQQFSITGDSGAWTDYANTSMYRYGHSSWVSQAGLYLLGGGSGTTTEIVPGGMSFTLQNDTDEACSIPSDDSTSVILTGGFNTGTVVAEYDLQGFVELLPSLSEGRWLHACGTYHDGDHIVQVVAGGQDPDHSGKFLSSTEWLLAGVSQHWTTGHPLQRAMCCMAFSSTDNTMYILGGRDSNDDLRDEIYSHAGGSDREWKEAGRLMTKREYSAATLLIVNSDSCK